MWNVRQHNGRHPPSNVLLRSHTDWDWLVLTGTDNNTIITEQSQTASLLAYCPLAMTSLTPLTPHNTLYPAGQRTKLIRKLW